MHLFVILAIGGILFWSSFVNYIIFSESYTQSWLSYFMKYVLLSCLPKGYFFAWIQSAYGHTAVYCETWVQGDEQVQKN